jgi:hypothetical protein
VEDWRQFEEEVRHVYQALVSQKGEGTLVAQNARIKGRSGTFHQVDVYYEFDRDGVRYKVAIECADTKLPVEKGRIGDFAFRLNDIGNIIGVVVSRGGYQLGADTLAGQYGIELLQPQDLPLMGTLLAKQMAIVALPDETSVGQPFWTVMALRDGRTTGSYYATEQPGTNRRHIPLMYSRGHAERILREGRLDPQHWGVRGLPAAALPAFVHTLDALEKQGGGAVVLFLPPAARGDADFIAMPITTMQLAEQYGVAPAAQAGGRNQP